MTSLLSINVVSLEALVYQKSEEYLLGSVLKLDLHKHAFMHEMETGIGEPVTSRGNDVASPMMQAPTLPAKKSGLKAIKTNTGNGLSLTGSISTGFQTGRTAMAN